MDKYPVLLNTYRMIDLPPQIYTLNGWMDLLQRYGPLAVIVDATAPKRSAQSPDDPFKACIGRPVFPTPILRWSISPMEIAVT